MPGLIDTDLGLCEIDNGLIWLEGGLGGAGLSPEPLPPGTMITEAGIIMITEVSGATMITETDLTPSWVLSVGGFGADLDIDFVGDQAWDGATVAIADLLTCVRASPALTYAQTSAGTLTSFAANALRITDLGLLVEEGRTNIGTHSQTLSNADWNNGGGTVADNAVVAPDGTTTGSRFTEDTNGGNHRILQFLTQAANTPSAFTLYIKATGVGAARYVKLSVSNAGGFFAVFDPNTGTITDSGDAGDGTLTSASITAMANGWYRCSVWGLPSAGSANPIILASLSDTSINHGVNSPAYTGDGVSGMYMWAAQYEAGSFATSYIPTTSASVTRSADVVTFATQTWQEDGRGTLYAETYLLHGPGNLSENDGRIVGTAGLGGVATLLAISGSGHPPATVTIETYNGTLLQVGNAIDPLNNNLSVVAYDQYGRSLCCNGGTVATDATAIGAGDDAPWEIGRQSSTQQCINGYIPRLSYWDVRLTNANLVTLTS